MLGITWKYRVRNDDTRARRLVIDIIEKAAPIKCKKESQNVIQDVQRDVPNSDGGALF